MTGSSARRYLAQGCRLVQRSEAGSCRGYTGHQINGASRQPVAHAVIQNGLPSPNRR